MDRKKEIKTYIILAAGLMALGLTHYFSAFFSQFYNPKNHLSLHILMELISVSVAFAIALQGWMIFTHTLSRHRLFIGALFFCIAFLDILHVLSFNGMPFFIVENSVLRPTWFWIVSRFILSIGLFMILTQKDRAIAPKYRSYIFLLSFVCVIIIASIIYFLPRSLPVLVVEGVGVTPLKRALEYILSFIFFSLMIVMVYQYRKSKNPAQLVLIAAVGFCFFSEIIFTLYKSVHDFDNFMGHIYKVISYYFLMQGLYASTIEEPFFKQREAQLALKKSEGRLHTIVSTVPSGIIITDSNGFIQYVNKKVERISGYTSDELLNKHMNDPLWHKHPIDVRAFPSLGSQNQRDLSETNESLYMSIKKGGEKVFLSVNSTDMFDEKGERNSIIFSLSDITELMNAQEKLNYLAYYDELTGLPNRYYFKEQLEKVLIDNSPAHRAALLFINLNRFRTVNESLGTDTGDVFLAVIAKRLKGYCEPRKRLVSRVGGDEFAILITDPKDSSLIEDMAKTIHLLLQSPLKAKGFTFHIDPVIGISIVNEEIENGEQLLKNARIAMHEAQKNNLPYMFYSHDSDKKLYEEIVLENDLRKAVERNELLLYYQPQINLDTGKLIGVEALIRWQHPVRGMIPPNKFIPLAEESGLIVQIGKWVIEEACRQMKDWLASGFSCSRISVNLSRRQFFQDDLVELVAEALKKADLEPHFLELEITESMTMDVERAITMLQDLKTLGVRIAIDDFGTGYSSFSNLHLLPVDQLKIDQSFIRNLSKDKTNEAIVGTIISLTHHLQLELIAEGVETTEQAEFLSRNQCYGIQGYLISKPLPATRVADFFQDEVLYSRVTS